MRVGVLGPVLLIAISACARMPVPTGDATKPALAAAPASAPSPVASNGQGDPANGAKLFAQLPCSSCHDVTHPFPGGQVGPNLGNIASEAARIINLSEYRGKATDPGGYLRESILDPNAYIVPGDVYSTADHQSVMPKDFGKTLTPQQIDDLVAYLLTLK